VVTHGFVPGGTPREGSLRPKIHLLRMLGALRDGKFRLLLIVFGMSALAAAPMVFLPTYLTERVGLSRAQVVRLDIATMVGNIVSAFFWGHWADRHGGRNLLLGSTIVGACLSPLYLLLPGVGGMTAHVAVAIALVCGVVSMAGQAGGSKLLFGDIVPPHRGQHYLSMWYAWSGLVGGVGPLLAGRALESLHWLRWDWGNLEIDAYVVLFVLSSAVSLATAAVLTRLKSR
jgi:MFS family permease